MKTTLELVSDNKNKNEFKKSTSKTAAIVKTNWENLCIYLVFYKDTLKFKGHTHYLKVRFNSALGFNEHVQTERPKSSEKKKR